MAYGITATVRNLTGNLLPADISDSELLAYQEAADDLIGAEIPGKVWSSLDTQWELIQTIEHLIAAGSALLEGGPDSKTEADKLYNRGLDLLGRLKANFVGTGADTEILFRTSQYKSFPASLQDNPDATIYRSTTNQLATMGMGIRDILYGRGYEYINRRSILWHG